MATTASINSLVTLVRQRSDQIGSTTFDDTAELKPWVRQSLAQLHEIFCQRFADWYTVSVPLSLHQSVEAYTVPSDFKKLNALYMLFGGGATRMKLQEYDIDDHGAFNAPMLARQPFAYRLYRDLIYLQPVPPSDAFNAIELRYTPQHRGPLLDYTPVDEVFPQGYQEWVVLDVMQKMNIKTRLQNMDDIVRSKSEIEARLIAGSASRSDTAPRMRDRQRPYVSPVAFGMPSGPAYWARA